MQGAVTCLLLPWAMQVESRLALRFRLHVAKPACMPSMPACEACKVCCLDCARNLLQQAAEVIYLPHCTMYSVSSAMLKTCSANSASFAGLQTAGHGSMPHVDYLLLLPEFAEGPRPWNDNYVMDRFRLLLSANRYGSNGSYSSILVLRAV